MAYIVETDRKKGKVFVVCYRTPEAKDRKKTFRTKGDAITFKKTVEGQMASGAFNDPIGGRELFGAWAAERLDAQRENLRPSSFDRDERYLRNHVVPAFGNRQLASIKQADVQRWVTSLTREKELAPRTVRECYRIFAAMMRRAVTSKKIVESPCIDIDLPRIPKSNRRFLEEEQVRLLADAIDPRYRTLVIAGGYLGLRWGELSGLKWSALHLDDGEVRIQASIERDGNGYRFTEELKNEATRRTIAIPPFLVNLLREEQVASSSEFVFASPKGGFLRYHTFRRRFWNPAVEASGVGPLTPHELRHSHVAWLIRWGWTEHEIVVRMGWTSSVMLHKTYGHLFRDHQRERVAQMGAMYGEQSFEVPPATAPQTRHNVSRLSTTTIEDAV